MEHILDIDGILAGCFRGLCPESKLVITVPLAEMNHHLLLFWRWYSRMRQQQLAHLNLFTPQKWYDLLQSIRFSHVKFRPYLSESDCRFWDMLDSPGCIGFGTYRLSSVLGFTASKLLPAALENQVLRRLSEWLIVKANEHV